MEYNQNETFQFSYSAKQQEGIKSIRQKYEPKEEGKMEQLRRLDAGVTQKGTVLSLVVGIVSCLLFGTGMSCVMVFSSRWFIPGIVIGIVGLVGVALAYPLFLHVTQRERERIAPEVLRLADELMK